MTLLTVEEAAELARVSRPTILRAAARGEFLSMRAGARVIRISHDSFMQWLWGPDWRSVVGEAA